jgi:Ca2+-binding RTX toxin-like protein
MAVIRGTTNNDDLVGTREPDSIIGLAGDDILDGGVGLDTLDGGDGDDIYILDKIPELKSGFTDVSGVSGFTSPNYSTISYWSSNYQLQIDAMFFSESSELYWGQGSYAARGGKFVTAWFSFASEGGLASEQNVGDSLFYNYHIDQDQIVDSGGTDLVKSSLPTYTLGSTLENLELTGSENINGDGNDLNNRLTGNSGKNTLMGYGGDDVLDGGTGADLMQGGDGDDTYYVDNSGDVVSETSTGGFDLVAYSLASYVLGANIESGRILSTGTSNLGGNALDNVLYAGSGNNSLFGNTGFDTVSYEYADAVTINLGITVAQVTGGSGEDTLGTIEAVIGSQFNDTLIGNAQDNTLDGNVGRDVVRGEGGNDTLMAEGGYSATLESIDYGKTYDESGNLISGFDFWFYHGETLDGGTGNDFVSYANAQSSVVVNLASGLGYATGAIALLNSRPPPGTGIGNFINDVEHAISDFADQLWSIENIIGSSFNDVLTGDDGANILSGRSGADTLIGGLGNDAYYVDNIGDVVRETDATLSSGGTDTVHSALNAYTLGANVENGRLTATGVAALTGNSLNNTLIAGAGNNVLNGMSGVDTVSYIYAGSAVTVSLAVTTAQATGGSGSDTLIAIENLTGSNYDDTLMGSAAANLLYGGTGNDVLNGGAGLDRMTGGEGSDTYYVDNTGDVVIETNATASTGGNDTVYSSLSAYTLGANVEEGRILATGVAALTGNSLNNTLYAGAGNNVLNGSTGVDIASYIYAGSAVTVSLALTTAQATGGSGSDTLLAIENLTGSDYNDKLTGNAAANLLNGGAGNDVLDGGAGLDRLMGGDGSDIYYVDNAGDVVIETNTTVSTGGSDTVYSALGAYTLGANVENGRIFATGVAAVTGNDLNNTLYAGAGNNVLNGSTGVDTVSYAYADSAVTVSLAVATAQATGGSGSDTLVAIENLTGSNYNDKLTGNAAANLLNGGAGNDVLNGGADLDRMTGGDGSDLYYVDNIRDVVVETNATASTGGSDTVYSFLSVYTLGANVENGRLLTSGVAALAGNSLDNTLYAGAGNNVLDGSTGIDTASYLFAGSAVTASLALTTAQATGGSGADTLLAIENLTGSSYNDRLTGNATANLLNGGSGNDILIGGMGKDVLIGGAGNDIFDFNAVAETGLTSSTWDIISDFTRGADKIDLSTLDANTATVTNEAFNSIIGSTAAFSAAGQLKVSAGVLYGNTDADSAAEFAIQIVGLNSATTADFIL